MTKNFIQDEKIFKEYKTPTPKSIKELSKLISELLPENERDYSYQEDTRALVVGLELVFNFMRAKLTATNESFSEAELIFLMRQRKTDAVRVLNYKDLLYPQCCNEEHFPTAQYLIRINQAYLRDKAQKLIDENKEIQSSIHSNVWQHWEKLAK